MIDVRPARDGAEVAAALSAELGAPVALVSARAGEGLGRVHEFLTGVLPKPAPKELPVLQDASVRWGKRVAFLGVDLKDNRGSAERLLHQIPLTYPSYEDPDGKVYNGYKLLGTPSTIYYNAQGKQTYVHSGPYESREQIDQQIKRYALAGDRRPAGT